MANTSATGGYLTETSGPVEGQALDRFLHGLVAGVTGLPADLVRPTWQPNPPKQPDIAVNWCAYGIQARRSQAVPFERQDDAGATLIRHEDMEILTVFYGPLAADYANRLRDGLYISQNRELLFLAGMGVVGFDDARRVPEFINGRWFNRVDLMMTLRREIRREYRVLFFQSAEGIIIGNADTRAFSSTWSVQE